MTKQSEYIQVRSKPPVDITREQWLDIINGACDERGQLQWKLTTQALMSIPEVKARVIAIQKGERK